MANIDDIDIEVKKLPTLLGESLGDSVADISELAIDSVIQNGLLKEIPIVGTIVGFCKLGMNLKERNLLKQALNFINEFNNGTMDPEKLKKYQEEIKSNPKKAEEELGRCLLILNSTIETIHSKIQGRLFSSYVNQSISWDKYVELSDAANRLFVADMKALVKIDSQPDKYVGVQTNKAYNYFRLQSLGLLTSGVGMFDMGDENSGDFDMDSNVFTLSPFGKTFLQCSGLQSLISQ